MWENDDTRVVIAAGDGTVELDNAVRDDAVGYARDDVIADRPRVTPGETKTRDEDARDIVAAVGDEDASAYAHPSAYARARARLHHRQDERRRGRVAGPGGALGPVR